MGIRKPKTPEQLEKLRKSEEDYQKYLEECEEIGKKNREERQELIEKTSFENGIKDISRMIGISLIPEIVIQFATMHKKEIEGASDLFLLFSIYSMCNAFGVNPNFKVLNDLTGMDSERIQELSEYLLEMRLISK